MTTATMHPWALVTRRSGASPVPRIAAALLARGVRVAGFTQDPIDEEGERTGYELRRLEHGDRRPIARRATGEPSSTECSFCAMHFDESAFAAARDWLREDAGRAEIVLVDAVSKLEAAGRGHAGAVADSLRHSALVVLAVPPEQLFAVMERFQLPEPLATLEDPSESAFESFVEAVVEAVPRSELIS
ncbi:MAG: DUF2478 domain-containing protein [Deltaproteobacteria bacterium]|nr:DUF2478 domain-containing protein [Deltaproteobacteria bacterium]